MDAFGIINMNGRVYDPMTAVFFSPDPFIQSPENWLNYNRYGYCLNNPLKYTDPSGFSFLSDIIIGTTKFIWNVIVIVVATGVAIVSAIGGMYLGAVIGGGPAGLVIGMVVGGYVGIEVAEWMITSLYWK
jgi:RHS repeat-associated protein